MPVVGEVVGILTWGCWENIEHLGKNMEKSTFFSGFCLNFNVFLCISQTWNLRIPIENPCTCQFLVIVNSSTNRGVPKEWGVHNMGKMCELDAWKSDPQIAHSNRHGSFHPG
jgi:hypothetical protein